uniref:Cupin 2, conserved barrel domain protein n=1 Tax=Solibacter usitatus (strain Ellin6076) TaxID=234267 RepID=Q01R90_SOLUE
MRRIRTIHFDKAADVPNSNLPVLLYRSVLESHTASKARTFRERFRGNGWVGIWTDTIYDYVHFHSNAHEVLGIAEGRVTLRLGGEQGSLVRLKAGDMLVLPAGVGHRRVGESDVKVIGAYPPGQSHYDMKREGRRVPKVTLPATDPFYGAGGPLAAAWPVKAAARPRKG